MKDKKITLVRIEPDLPNWEMGKAIGSQAVVNGIKGKWCYDQNMGEMVFLTTKPKDFVVKSFPSLAWDMIECHYQWQIEDLLSDAREVRRQWKKIEEAIEKYYGEFTPHNVATVSDALSTGNMKALIIF